MPISLSGSLNLSGSLTTTGTITATTLVVQTITSSISSITGSTNFGSIIGNTHTFTGSLNASGSANFSGSVQNIGGSGFATSIDGGFRLRNDANNANLGGLVRRSYWAGGAALDTQIFAETGYSIYLNVNGSSTTGMFISSSGNVGIGTSTPTDVAGFTSLTINNNASGPLIDLNNSGVNNMRFLCLSAADQRIYGAGALSFYTSGSNRMSITSAGNILIDNAQLNTPKYLAFEANNNGVTNNTLGDIRWYNYQWDTAIRAQIKGEFDSSLANGRLMFFTSTVERVRIGAIGNLANIIGASDANSKIYLGQISSDCGLVPVPAGTTLYLYSRSGGTNYRVLQTSSTYFTGQHGNKPVNEDLKTNIQNYIGLIVRSTGTYYSVNPITQAVTTGKNAITISESLPEIELVNTDKDKAVWGVVTNVKNDNYNTDGTTEFDNDPQFGDRLGENVIRVNGLGEGAIWVTNINGNVENGDYICSSIIPGYGRKQDDDLLHNYTVAKSTMDCDFDLNNDNLYVCEEFEFEGQTYKKAFIGCTYHCS